MWKQPVNLVQTWFYYYYISVIIVSIILLLLTMLGGLPQSKKYEWNKSENPEYLMSLLERKMKT